MQETKAIWSAFGLTIESELDLPELPRSTGQADVSIVLGKAPEHLASAFFSTPWYEASEKRFLLKVYGIAKFYVEHGNLIVVEPLKGASPEDLRVFLFGNAFSVLLQQRGLLALHGAAAVVNGKGVALLGASQAGKTAAMLALHDRGCPVLTDEICALEIRNGKTLILPGVPQLNVWNDTLTKMGRDAAGLEPIRRGLEKYAYHEDGLFTGEPAELSHIVLLENYNKETISVESVRGGKKLESLLLNVPFAGATGKDPKVFRMCAAAVQNASVLQVTYYNAPGRMCELADVLLKEIR